MTTTTTAISQVHPNKTQAEVLHRESPDIYKDDNHKPELAIALTPFLAMCGFREYHEIAIFLDIVPPLKQLIGEDFAAELKGANPAAALKQCFTQLMTATDAQVRETIRKVETIVPALPDPLVVSTFWKLTAEYPNDVGILSVFFLNVLELKPGEAIFLGANEPHAYLSGDCIECMACSDNVIRAGLTPKFKDVKSLLEMVNYNAESKSRKFFNPEICCDGFSKLFIPPVPDFAVKEIRIPAQEGVTRYQLNNWAVGSILLVLQGEARLKVPKEFQLDEVHVKQGSIVFIPSTGNEGPASYTELQLLTAEGDTFLAYQAFHNEFQ